MTTPFLLNERLPDPAVKAIDKSFEKYRVPLASVERLAQGFSWAEGPVYFGDARCLLWSDIPNSRIMRWDEETGVTGIYRKPSNYANGNTRDRQGRLVTAEHGRRVTRTEYDGRITVLSDRFEGKPLNSPNDVVVKSDDSIWFTDMNAGIIGNWNGEMAEQELPMRVYRIDGKTGQAAVMTEGVVQRPNGLAFSPDEKTLYVVESQFGERAIYAFDVVDGVKLANGRMIVKCTKEETPDGFRVDIDGNLWCGWGMGSAALDGVRIFTPQGQPIGHIELPERCANVCFGGPKRNRLFMAASHSLYAIYVNTQGAKGG
ncbi:MAG: SMP-30/gluconolactonase/LRE family protein [Rhizobiales bacterium]|jgi:gluconolactonase|nr:SMP-30/gluconolactonase/LRE family protein [Hyphomicrobiales bacterium]